MKLNIPSDGTKIGHDGEKLVVPNNPIIPYIIGDGIGIDVTPVMKRVLDYAVNKAYGNSREIRWLELYAGSNSEDLYGSILPDETLEAMKEYRISIRRTESATYEVVHHITNTDTGLAECLYELGSGTDGPEAGNMSQYDSNAVYTGTTNNYKTKFKRYIFSAGRLTKQKNFQYLWSNDNNSW